MFKTLFTSLIFMGFSSLSFTPAAFAQSPKDATIKSTIVGDPIKGKRIFKRCKVCHTIKPGKNKIGPSLSGIIGRKSATIKTFKYSKAMAATNVVWTPDILNIYLKSPRHYVKGTKMTFAGIRNDKKRANLIAYLISLQKEGQTPKVDAPQSQPTK